MHALVPFDATAACARRLQVHLLEQLLDGRRDLLLRAPAIQQELTSIQAEAEVADERLKQLMARAEELKQLQVCTCLWLFTPRGLLEVAGAGTCTHEPWLLAAATQRLIMGWG